MICQADDTDQTQDPYSVEWVHVDEILPSPENDEIYGEVKNDEDMKRLIESVGHRGLAEPIIVSGDNYIVSGHRRYYAWTFTGQNETIPVRRVSFTRADNLERWHKILTEYNPQRIKTVASLLKETLLRNADDDSSNLLRSHQESSIRGDAEFLPVSGKKSVRKISAEKQEFLKSIVGVVTSLRKFWPLTIRQIHYNLLNKPPLMLTPKRSKFSREHHRYKNDKRSYQASIELCKQARYSGDLPMESIDDPTRPMYEFRGFNNLAQFINSQMEGFLVGYHRDRQLDQPRHIEVLGEKSTMLGILRPVCKKYYVPLTLARGYASLPVWRDIARRYRRSNKDAMTLIVASDHDPEGLDLAEDAIRNLRDLWGIPADYQRVAVKREQIDALNLSEDFNPAKESSSRFNKFVQDTGSSKTWELESLPPEFLQEQVRAAIESNMDMGLYRDCIERERHEADELAEIRRQIVDSISF